jgi:hypothetical protein
MAILSAAGCFTRLDGQHLYIAAFISDGTERVKAAYRINEN